MKKTLLSISLLTAIIAGIYFGFSAKREAKTAIAVSANSRAANRLLGLDSIWQACWPDTTSKTLQLNGNTYKINQVSFGSISLTVQNGTDSFPCEILISPYKKDSLILSWTTTLTTNNLPWNRISLLKKQKTLQADQKTILMGFKAYLENNMAVYGVNVLPGKMTDSVVITTSFVTADFPSTPEVYSHIHQLEAYALQQAAKATNYPMLFVQKNSEGRGFKTQVALPVNKALNNTGTLLNKWMVLGNNLTVEVKGPQSLIDKNFKAVQNFISDYDFIMPAIPYESLVTNRMQEPDSTKWITRLFFPVY